eukprot:936999-Rhodomonas_salina.2
MQQEGGELEGKYHTPSLRYCARAARHAASASSKNKASQYCLGQYCRCTRHSGGGKAWRELSAHGIFSDPRGKNLKIL